MVSDYATDNAYYIMMVEFCVRKAQIWHKFTAQ